MQVEIESKLINTQGGSIRVIAKKNRTSKIGKTIGLLLKEKREV